MYLDGHHGRRWLSSNAKNKQCSSQAHHQPPTYLQANPQTWRWSPKREVSPPPTTTTFWRKRWSSIIILLFLIIPTTTLLPAPINLHAYTHPPPILPILPILRPRSLALGIIQYYLLLMQKRVIRSPWWRRVSREVAESIDFLAGVCGVVHEGFWSKRGVACWEVVLAVSTVGSGEGGWALYIVCARISVEESLVFSFHGVCVETVMGSGFSLYMGKGLWRGVLN